MSRADDDPEEGGGIEDYEDSTRATRPSERGREALTEEAIEKFIDILIVKLRRRKYSFRAIGRILNRSHRYAVAHYHAIPLHVRTHYEKLEMG